MAEPALLPDPVASPPGPPPSPPSPAPASPPLRVVEGPAGGPTRSVPRLEIPPYDLQAALSLERKLGVSHVLAQVLVRRGLTDPAAARAFLDAAEEHPPRAFRGIERVLDVVQRHVRTGNRITVHGDYDVDGVCATAILVRGLRSLGADVDWFLPDRLSDGYGLSMATVRRLADRGSRLLVTADCAITAVEEVEAATALGLEVIVTDHHQLRPDGQLPGCPIVHPVVCAYPCAELCGTGVAYKLAQALDAATAAEDLELVALATVADLMPLRGENRRLVRQGLRALGVTAKPGLRALMEVSGADPSALDAQTLGFRLAPRINAAGRLRRADAGLELLLTEDSRRAAEIAAELDLVNSERRNLEHRILWEAEAEAQASELGDPPAFVLAGEEWHPGVVGIVASRIAERYHRPAVLIARRPDVCQGSARSIPGFDLLAGLQACAGHLERFGGHRAAAGLTIRPERIDAFRLSFEEFAESVLTPELRTPVEQIDAIVSGSELGLPLIDELELLEPSGIGNPRSRLLVPGARFGDLRPMGEGRHARFTVTAGGTCSPAVSFGCDGRLPAAQGEPVDATFRLERNCWNGTVSPRLLLRSAWLCAPSAIEVLGEPDDYLGAVLDEVAVPLAPGRESPDRNAMSEPAVARTLLDRRGESSLAVLADALAGGGPVLAVCADVARRLEGLASRVGGFSLISYHGLGRDPSIATGFAQVVALDPPTGEAHARLLREGAGFTQLAWGEAELRFAQQMHELEYGLRTSLVALYRALRLRRRVAGEELERLLRGEGPHGRPARLAGRLVRVLAELELVSLDPELPALAIAGVAPTALDRSPSYRVYATRHEDGRQYLNSANPRPSG
jgi:single-stranded-DNA-specific exonuclease